MSWGLETVNAVGWWVESKPCGAAMAEAAARFKRASYARHLDHAFHAHSQDLSFSLPCFSQACSRHWLKVRSTNSDRFIFLIVDSTAQPVKRVQCWLHVLGWCSSATLLDEPLHTRRLHLHHPARSRHALSQPFVIHSATETIFPLQNFQVYPTLLIIHKEWACTPLSVAVPITYRIDGVLTESCATCYFFFQNFTGLPLLTTVKWTFSALPK